MGIAIHYNGRLEDRARLEELLDAARFFCAEQRWGYLDVDEPIVGQVEWTAESGESDGQLSPIDDECTGISITVHPRSEPLRLTFNRAGELAYYLPLDDKSTYWEIKSFSTQLQAAGFAAHIAVCELLRLIQQDYMPGLNVNDEANYFETGDSMRLAGSIQDAETETAPLNIEAENSAEDATLGQQFPDEAEPVPSQGQQRQTPRFKKKHKTAR